MIGVAGRLSARVERRRGLENGDGLLQLGVLPLQLPDLPRRGGRRPVDLAGLDLGLTQPLPHRLRIHPQPARDRLDRLILQPKSSRCSCTNRTALARGLLVVLLRHGSHLPNQEGVHQTRDGSGGLADHSAGRNFRQWASMWQELRGYGFRRRCLGGVTRGYVAGRWVWSNAAAKSRVRG